MDMWNCGANMSWTTAILGLPENKKGRKIKYEAIWVKEVSNVDRCKGRGDVRGPVAKESSQ